MDSLFKSMMNEHDRMMREHNQMMQAHRQWWRGFDDFFSEPFAPSQTIMPALTSSNENAILRRSSPHYEITEDDKKFQIAVDVPGVNKGDMTVELEHDGRVLKISGSRSIKKDNSTSETKFEKKMTISSHVDVEKMSANLADGVLVVTAPKKEEKEKAKQIIPIMEGPPKLLE